MNGAPERIGRYVVERPLGSGGMGEVFLGYSPAGDPVAVKQIRPDRLDPEMRARFEKEALVARTVVGTNRVARFLDADPYAERPWLAMEYVPGPTLLDYVQAHGPLPAPLVASLGALLAEGLSAVHAVGLLHRDLKPQNVILGAYGPVLIDFGLAAFLDAGKGTLAQSGMIIGTIRCMAPEQARGEKHVGPAVDVYGLGTVLLFAATGRYPYDGARWEAIAAQIANPEAEPNLGGVPQEVLPVIASLLSFAPEDRPSLADATKRCADALSEAGVTPAQARHALVDLTADGAGAVRDRSLLVLFEDNARELRDVLEEGEDGDWPSPLDAPPVRNMDADEEEESGNGGAAEAGRSVPQPRSSQLVTPPADPVATPGATSRQTVPPAGTRPPASQRVADDLRAKYAAQPAL